MNSLIIRMLLASDETAFLRAYAATETSDPNFAHFYKKGIPFLKYVEILKKNELGSEIPEGLVSSSCLYAFAQDEIVGRLSLRHELNDYLFNFGGHIGYVVVPAHRRKGYATQMLQTAKELAKTRGMNRVLLTCDVDNLGSQKTIEKCGGVFENIISDPKHGTKRRYWIALP
jgi:predicted acetyltransferase